jgi:hypothetical protein
MAKERWKVLLERDWFALSLEERRKLGRAATFPIQWVNDNRLVVPGGGDPYHAVHAHIRSLPPQSTARPIRDGMA